MARITTLHTRFVDLGVRGYIGVTRVGVPGHRRPFSDTWWRYFDETDNQDIGPSFPTKAECLSYLPTYAEQNGYACRDASDMSSLVSRDKLGASLTREG